MNKVTLKDVAKIAGVSARTVSRVINNESSIKDETRETVLNVIKKTGYQVNLVAQSLKKRKTGIVVVFVQENEHSYLGQFHSTAIKYMRIEANKLGYKLIVAQSSASEVRENEHDGFYLLRNGFADGAVFFDSKQEDARLQYAVDKDMPFVVVGKDVDHEITSWVNLNNIKAGFIGTEYLINNGYKRITFLLGDENFTVNKDRAKGFKKAFHDYNVDENLGDIQYGVINPEIAFKKMIKIIKNNQIPESIFVSGDERALAVYSAIQKKGLKIPEDIAVIGIDNIPMSRFYYPPLTTIDQSINQMATQAIKILDNQLKNPEVKSCQRIVFEPTLVERQSVLLKK